MNQKTYIFLTFSMAVMWPHTGTSQDVVTADTAIFVERYFDDNNQTINGLRSRYEQCVNEKYRNMNLREEQPAIWQVLSQELGPDYIRNITTIPRREPLWERERVGQKRTREYFHGDQYVIIQERFKYNFTTDGLCSLTRAKKENRTIDNGVTIIQVSRETAPETLNPNSFSGDPWMDNDSFIKRHIKSASSPSSDDQQVPAELRQIVEDSPSLLNRFSRLLNRNPSAPSSNSSNGSVDISQRVREGFDMNERPVAHGEAPSANPDNYAGGQTCDWVSSEAFNSRVCYWSQQHTYPNRVKRPIILKKEYNNARESAITFRIIESIPSSLLNPPQS